MDDKIINFLKTSKEREQELPPDQNSILKLLNEVPPDIAKEYSEVITNYIEELLILRGVISSIRKPHLCQYLTDNIDQNMLIKIRNITLDLSSKEPEEKIDEIIKNTFNIVIPSEETISKAAAFIKELKICNDHDAESKRLAILSADLRLLADFFAILNMGQEFEQVIFNRLSQLTECDLDRLIGRWN